MRDEADRAVAVRLTARMWAGIDATIDNAISIAAVDGDEETLRVGGAIRQAGWDQVPWVDGDWPPMDQTITITLGADQWRFAMTEVESSNRSYERLGDDESLELGRGALAAVTPQLT